MLTGHGRQGFFYYNVLCFFIDSEPLLSVHSSKKSGKIRRIGSKYEDVDSSSDTGDITEMRSSDEEDDDNDNVLAAGYNGGHHNTYATTTTMSTGSTVSDERSGNNQSKSKSKSKSHDSHRRKKKSNTTESTKDIQVLMEQEAASTAESVHLKRQPR